MNPQTENTLRENQLAALGKLLAAYTHELKNHLAIINESAGLMSDLLHMADYEVSYIQPKLQKSITTINQRVDLANTMSKHLNSLAHRMDMPTSTFNINDVITEELALLNRFAAWKSITIKQTLADELPAVTNSPALLQFMLFVVVQDLLDHLASESTIHFATRLQGKKIELLIEGLGPSAKNESAEEPHHMAEILDIVSQKTMIGFHQDQKEKNHLCISLSLSCL